MDKIQKNYLIQYHFLPILHEPSGYNSGLQKQKNKANSNVVYSSSCHCCDVQDYSLFHAVFKVIFFYISTVMYASFCCETTSNF
jgi:hypothetical protein